MAEIGFSGGEKLKKYLEDLAEKSTSAKVNVGFFEGATYPDGTPVAAVAAIQNYGAPKASIPPRPFFSNAIKDNSPDWGDRIGEAIDQLGYDSVKVMDAMGQEIQGEIREAIVNISGPALSPITVMLRGMRSHDQSLVVTGKTVGEAAQRVAAGLTDYGASTTPLRDTKTMLNSVEYKVDESV